MLRPEFPDAFANLVHSLVFVCDWSNRDNDFAVLRKILAAQVREGGDGGSSNLSCL